MHNFHENLLYLYYLRIVITFYWILAQVDICGKVDLSANHNNQLVQWSCYLNLEHNQINIGIICQFTNFKTNSILNHSLNKTILMIV